jgi:hypothetical protein
MSTRNQRTGNGNARAISEAPASYVAAWADLPRRQAALMAHSATALFRGSQEVMRINMQQSMQYWSELAQAALQLQTDMVNSASEAAVQGASEPTLESLQRVFEATLNGGNAAATH